MRGSGPDPGSVLFAFIIVIASVALLIFWDDLPKTEQGNTLGGSEYTIHPRPDNDVSTDFSWLGTRPLSPVSRLPRS
jgi:hypothetical protein